jgi:hypothetical protein
VNLTFGRMDALAGKGNFSAVLSINELRGHTFRENER